MMAASPQMLWQLRHASRPADLYATYNGRHFNGSVKSTKMGRDMVFATILSNRAFTTATCAPPLRTPSAGSTVTLPCWQTDSNVMAVRTSGDRTRDCTHTSTQQVNKPTSKVLDQLSRRCACRTLALLCAACCTVRPARTRNCEIWAHTPSQSTNSGQCAAERLMKLSGSRCVRSEAAAHCVGPRQAFSTIRQAQARIASYSSRENHQAILGGKGRRALSFSRLL
jgi:hypothetical protein